MYRMEIEIHSWLFSIGSILFIRALSCISCPIL